MRRYATPTVSAAMSRDFATGCSGATARTFVTADLHFGDGRLCGSKERPFHDAKLMDAGIIALWNETVAAEDTVYVMGDVGRGSRAIEALRKLQGIKHLVVGNCDDVAGLVGSGLFASVSVWRRLPGCVLTHLPVHPSLLTGNIVNIHGHLHSKSLRDARYVCVSVEQTNFRPVLLKASLQKAA